jgi:hypothetical protein
MLARSLMLGITAEGVEESAQVEFLRENGCDTIQGYYYSRPLDAAAWSNTCNGFQRRAGQHGRTRHLTVQGLPPAALVHPVIARIVRPDQGAGQWQYPAQRGHAHRLLMPRTAGRNHRTDTPRFLKGKRVPSSLAGQGREKWMRSLQKQ